MLHYLSTGIEQCADLTTRGGWKMQGAQPYNAGVERFFSCKSCIIVSVQWWVFSADCVKGSIYPNQKCKIMAESIISRHWGLSDRIKFAKKHGYKYAGNGWFIYNRPSVNFLLYYKCVSLMSINERINLRSNMLHHCRKYNVFPTMFTLLRIKSHRFYMYFYFNSPFSFGTPPSVK